MAAHYCINCPRCKGGCCICRRCACSEAQLAELFKPFEPVTLVTTLGPSEEEEEQLPETD